MKTRIRVNVTRSFGNREDDTNSSTRSIDGQQQQPHSHYITSHNNNSNSNNNNITDSDDSSPPLELDIADLMTYNKKAGKAASKNCSGCEDINNLSLDLSQITMSTEGDSFLNRSSGDGSSSMSRFPNGSDSFRGTTTVTVIPQQEEDQGKEETIMRMISPKKPPLLKRGRMSARPVHIAASLITEDVQECEHKTDGDHNITVPSPLRRCKSLSKGAPPAPPLVQPPTTPKTQRGKISLGRFLSGNLQPVVPALKGSSGKSVTSESAKSIKKRSASTSSKRHRTRSAGGDDAHSTASEKRVVERSAGVPSLSKSGTSTTRLRVVTAQDLRLAIEAKQKASTLRGGKRVIRRKSNGHQFQSTEDVLDAYSDIMGEFMQASSSSSPDSQSNNNNNNVPAVQ